MYQGTHRYFRHCTCCYLRLMKEELKRMKRLGFEMTCIDCIEELQTYLLCNHYIQLNGCSYCCLPWPWDHYRHSFCYWDRVKWKQEWGRGIGKETIHDNKGSNWLTNFRYQYLCRCHCCRPSQHCYDVSRNEMRWDGVDSGLVFMDESIDVLLTSCLVQFCPCCLSHK